MWTTILIIIGFILVLFLKDFIKDKKRISDSGGIRNQYSELIQLIIKNDLNTRIIKETNNTIIIKASGITVTVLYNLVWAFNSLTVQYTIDSPATGKHGFELVFRDNKTQQQMYDDIVERINILYHKMGV